MATVTGELGGQPILLENAATEATLNALLQATLANSSNRSQAAKIQQAYEEAVKRTSKAQKENKEAIENEEKKRKDLNKQIIEEKERREKMMQGMSEAASALKNFGQTLGNLIGGTISVAFNSATPKVSDFTDALSGIPIIGPIIGAVGKAMQDQIDKFRELSQVGADFGSGVNTMRSMASQAGLSLETYTKAITANSQSLAMLGGSTTAGARIFTAVNKSLQGPFQLGLARLGFSMEETAEYTAGYLAQQTRLGRAQRMSQEELNEGTKEYLLELDMLARVHGMTRKEAQAALDEQYQDKRFKLFYAQMGAMGNETASFMGALSKTNKQFSDGIADLILNNGVPSASNEMAQSIALQSPRLREMAIRLGQGAISQEEANKIVREESKRLGELATTQGKSQAMFLNLNSSVHLVNSAILGMNNYGLEAAKVEAARTEAMNDNTKNILNTDHALLSLRDRIMNSLMPVLDLFSDKIVNTVIPELARFVTELLQIATGEGGIKAALIFVVKEIGSVLGQALREVIFSPTVLGAFITGVGLLWAAGAIKMAIVKGIKDAFDSAKQGPRPGQYGGWESSMPEGPSESAGKGKWRKIGGNILKGGGAGIVGAGVEYAGEKVTEAGHTRTGAALEILGSTGQFAGMGAMLGSFAGPLGTAIGAGIGGTIGLGAGLWSSGGKLFGGDKSPAAPDSRNAAAATDPRRVDLNKADPDVQTAAMVATTTTPAQVKELAAALKDLDYSKLIVPDTAHKSMEDGVLKMRQLRGEVIAMSKAFKELNNTGLDKITQGLGRLDESFKSFNKSFVEDFITKFKELDKKSQETLLTDLNDKMDLLNTSVQSLVELEEENSRHHKQTARNTKTSSGRVN